MLYNFRIDRNSRDLILARLKSEKQLCQGWGGGAQGDLDLRKDHFVRRVQAHYGLSSTNIPTNLTRMRNFEDGDLLVTPHIPSDGKVSLHVVDGDYPDCYEYSEDQEAHLNHRIRVTESIGLDGSIDTGTVRLAHWKAKLPWMRLPVLGKPQFEAAFRDLLDEKRENPAKAFQRSDLEEFLEELRTRLLNQLADELQRISPAGGEVSFEAVCRRLLESAGYDVNTRHQFDREGGDVDFIGVREREDTSPFEQGQSRLFVQVKKQFGTSDRTGIDQVLKIAGSLGPADMCVMTLAEGFTPDATQLAEDEGVLLMTRDDICALVLAELGSWTAGV